MTIAEQIYALVQSLPQDKASQVLMFAESIRGELGSTRSGHADELPRAEFVYSLAGAWSDEFPSLEEIRKNAGQDIVRESL
jgi:hypothetical protein